MSDRTYWVVIEYAKVDIRTMTDAQPRWTQGPARDAHLVSAIGEQDAITKVGRTVGEGIFSAFPTPPNLPTCSMVLELHPDE